jgi:hypothetical protein
MIVNSPLGNATAVGKPRIGDWMNGPMSYELTAAEQNNGCAQVWAISLNQVLHSIAQTPRGWDMSWTPPRVRPQ